MSTQNGSGKIILLCILIALHSFPVVHAATVRGTIYDYDLKPVSAVITIDTIPKQTIVSQTGTYEVVLPVGTYTLTVSKSPPTDPLEADNQTIIIKDDAMYTKDFILFPAIDTRSDVQELDTLLDTTSPKVTIPLWPFLGIILIALGMGYLLRKQKKPQQQTDQDLAMIITYLKKHRRIQQKELRNVCTYSEAKISLMIAELEHKGRVQKIKKGRGNIIIFKR